MTTDAPYRRCAIPQCAFVFTNTNQYQYWQWDKAGGRIPDAADRKICRHHGNGRDVVKDGLNLQQWCEGSKGWPDAR